MVVAVGLKPCTELAESAGLETDPNLGGYRVNSELLACQDVWGGGFWGGGGGGGASGRS